MLSSVAAFSPIGLFFGLFFFFLSFFSSLLPSWARRRFEEIEGRWERACFHAWAEWTADLAAEKQRKLERAGRTLRNVAGYRAFRSWQVGGW